jgi:hypothetical protein
MAAVSEQAKLPFHKRVLISVAKPFHLATESLRFHYSPFILGDDPPLVIIRPNWPDNPGIWYADTNGIKEMPPIIFPHMGRCSNIIVGEGQGNVLFGHLSDNTLQYGDGGINKVAVEIIKVLGDSVRLDLYRLVYPFGEENQTEFCKILQESLRNGLRRHDIVSLTQDFYETMDAAYAGGRLARIINYQPGRSTNVSDKYGKWTTIFSDG